MNESIPYRVKVVHPSAYMQCSSYLVEGPEGALLIDPGSGCVEDELLSNLTKAGHPIETIKAIFITHCHADHAMGAERMRKHGPKLFASRCTSAFLRERNFRIWGEHPELIPQVNVDYEVEDMETLSLGGLDVLCLETPGHTPGCMSYSVGIPGGKTIGFTGDLLSSNCCPGWAGDPDFSKEQVIESLRHFEKYYADTVWTGHGGPITNVQEWIDKSIHMGLDGKWTLKKEFSYWKVPENLRSAIAD